jgi:osmotically-inducible protein OsmY
MRKHIALIALLATSLAAGPAFAAQQTPPKPDNTKVNKQPGKTADEQSQSKADLDLAKRVRSAIVKDKSLSTNAHNCKVITRDGLVTLRGPVKSDQERTSVEKIATSVAGAGKVKSELVVKSGK